MPLRSVLAAFSGDPASCKALEMALHLQRRDGAQVTGVVWHGRLPVESRHRAFMSRGVAEMLAGREDEAARAIRADFEARVAASGDPARATFIDLHEMEDISLPERARAYDLVVMTRRAAEVGHEHAGVRPDVIALHSGRPIVTVSDDYAGKLPEHVLLAWDGKRAAARALGDLVHVFGGVTRATVLTVSSGPEAPPEAGDDVIGLLARHGIEGRRIYREAPRQGITRAILDACAETRADMLVMGAYEHSKFSEDLWGGVTRDILVDAHLPVLMSH
jgi:nucleotide-binding universal stress UspA family protein